MRRLTLLAFVLPAVAFGRGGGHSGGGGGHGGGGGGNSGGGSHGGSSSGGSSSGGTSSGGSSSGGGAHAAPMSGARGIGRTLTSSPAPSGGALSQVVHGLVAANQGQNGAPGSGAVGYASVGSGVIINEGPLGPGAVVAGGAQVARPPEFRFRAYLGVQSVANSDGAGAVEVGATFGDFGLAVRGRRFFEDQMMGTTLRLDVGAANAQIRVVSGDAALWLEAGLGAYRTVADAHSVGPVIGARVEAGARGLFGAEAAARAFFFTDDVHMYELVAGVRVFIIEVSYRVFQWSVGPPLHGPEIGLQLSF